MAADIDICNLALDHLGVTKKIEKFTDGTKEANAAKRWYAHTRDVLLRALPWPFATAFAELTEITDTNPLWAHTFALPDNYAKSRIIWLPGRRVPTPPIPFDVVLNAGGDERVLVTDSDTVILEYTAQIGEALFTPHFKDILALRLALNLAQPLALASAAVLQQIKEQFRLALADAFAAEANGRTFDPPPEAEAITLRDS